jgi:chitosanase
MSSQKEKMNRVISAFESGGNYGQIDLYSDGKDGRRQVTYGRYCTTEDGGGLKILINDYIKANGLHAKVLANKYFAMNIATGVLWRSKKFISALKLAATDPIMHRVQDDFFDREYFDRARYWAQSYGFKLPLSMLVIYDSFIHSGSILDFLRKRFPELVPLVGGSEKIWIKKYCEVREKWLRTHERELLQLTACRPQAFLRAINDDNWNLEQPIFIPRLGGNIEKID